MRGDEGGVQQSDPATATRKPIWWPAATDGRGEATGATGDSESAQSM